MRISILIFINTIHFAYLKVYTKFENTGSEKFMTEIFIGEKEKWTNKGTDKQHVAVFCVTQCNLFLSSCVPNSRTLTLVVAEKSLAGKMSICIIRVTEGKMKNWKKKAKWGLASLFSFKQCTLPTCVHKILITLAPMGAENSVTEIAIGEIAKWTN